MARHPKRATFFITKAQAKYLQELVEDDLELDDRADTLTDQERQMCHGIIKRLGESLHRIETQEREERDL